MPLFADKEHENQNIQNPPSLSRLQDTNKVYHKPLSLSIHYIDIQIFLYSVTILSSIFSAQPNVIRLWEVTRCSAANQIHRNLTSTGYSANRAFPLWRMPLSLALVLALRGEHPCFIQGTVLIAPSCAPLGFGLFTRHKSMQVT